MANCTEQNVSKVHPHLPELVLYPFLPTDTLPAHGWTAFCLDRFLSGHVTSLGIDLGVEWLGHKVM